MRDWTRTLTAAALALGVCAAVALCAPVKAPAKHAAKATTKAAAKPAPTPATQPARSPVRVRAPYLWVLDSEDCTPGLRHQPDGPFATLVFCEQSLGVYLVVAYLESMQTPPGGRIGPWGVSDRIWQDSTWAADVTSYVWAPDGQSLITATSTNYGSGGLFQLNLAGRSVRQIRPEDRTVSRKEPGPGYVLEQIDLQTGVLRFHALPWNLPGGEAAEDSVQLVPLP